MGGRYAAHVKPSLTRIFLCISLKGLSKRPSGRGSPRLPYRSSRTDSRRPKIDYLERALARRVIGVDLSTTIALMATLAFIAFFTCYNVQQHRTFKTYAFDLGIYIQALHSTAFEGMLFYETPDMYHVEKASLLGVHFMPLVLLLVPLYRAFPYAETLFFVQALAVGASAIYLYLLSMYILRSRALSLAFLFTYIFNMHIHSMLMVPYHIETFVPLFALMSLYYLHRGNTGRFLASVILLSMTIDFSIFIAGCVALHALLVSRDRTSRIASAALLIFTAVLVPIAVTLIRAFGPEPLSFGGLFPLLGASWRDIIVNVVLNPGLVLRAVSYDFPLKMANLLLIVLPYSTVIFGDASSWIPLMPYLAVSFLSQRRALYLPGWHIQGAYALPLAAYAAIMGSKKLVERGRKGVSEIAAKIVLLTVLLSATLSPCLIPDEFFKTIYEYAPVGASYRSKPLYTEKTIFLNKALALIPERASVLAQNNIFPHLADRLNVYVWVPPNLTVDYAIADLGQHDYYTAYGDKPFNEQFEGLIDKGYSICASGHGVLVIAKTCRLALYVPLRVAMGIEAVRRGSFMVARDPERGLVAKYAHRGEMFIVTEGISLPPGLYEVVFWLKIGKRQGLTSVVLEAERGQELLARRVLNASELPEGAWTRARLAVASRNVMNNVRFKVIVRSKARAAEVYFLRVEVNQSSIALEDERDALQEGRALRLQEEKPGCVAHQVDKRDYPRGSSHDPSRLLPYICALRRA